MIRRKCSPIDYGNLAERQFTRVAGRGSLSCPSRYVLLALAAFFNLDDREIGAQPFKSEIDAWVAQDMIDPPPGNALLFLGSSTIRLWERIAQDFVEYDVIQRGFGGAKFSDLNRYVDQIVLPYDPAAIVLFAGANDLLSGSSPDAVFRSYRSFVDLVHSGQNPNRDPIPIFNIGQTASPRFWECCRTLASEWNTLIQQHAQSDVSSYYVDTTTPLLATAAGHDLPPSESLYLFDRAHLNQDGYDLWTETIKPLIESVVPPTKTYQPNVLHPPVGSRLLIDFGPNTSPSNLSLGTDENGNAWNNWLPEGRDGPSARVLAGRHMGDLITTSGDNTGVGIVITGEFVPSFGALQSPDRALLEDFAIESATVDYFASDDAFAPGGFMVTGLDVNAIYEFRFFASRQSTAAFRTEYLITGKDVYRTELQTSGRDIGRDGEFDGNDDEIVSVSGIRPNEFGQVFVDLEPLNGSQAYINAVEIDVLAIAATLLQAGDADQDLDFDQFDLIQVQVAGRYLTGQSATWGDGDWDNAPGGKPDDPPAGNGLFDQIDVIAALGAGTYLTGPYAVIQPNGRENDDQTSILYNASTGELRVDAGAAVELTSINIDSASGIFTGQGALNLGGSFDNDADSNIFKATFGSSFGSLSFGNVAQAGLSEEFVLGDLNVVGSLAAGGDLGNVDLIYVPEPTSVLLLTVALAIGLLQSTRSVNGAGN